MDLVDTDVLIDVQRAHPPALAWFAALTDLPAVPGLVIMELVQAWLVNPRRYRRYIHSMISIIGWCQISERQSPISDR